MSAGAVFAGIGLLGSVMQYKSTVAAGKAEREFYNAQARNKRLEGRVEAVKAKEKAVEILRRTKKALASNIAGGYAAGVSPYVGSVQTVSSQQVLRPAALDVGITDMDALLSVEQANREAGYLEYRGSMAARQAKTQALGNLVMSVAQVGMSGALSGLGPLDIGNSFGMGRSAMTTTPVMGNLASGGGIMSGANTAGNSIANFSTNPMFFNQMSPVNTSALNTAGGPSFMGI